MQRANKSLLILFVALFILGIAGFSFGLHFLYNRPASNSDATTQSDASSQRLPKYSPWGVLAGIGGCLCVLVFIKSMLDWFDRRDRKGSWACPKCKGINKTESAPCPDCGGTGRIQAP